MCGIAGNWDRLQRDVCVVEKMAKQVRHRGPNDSGVWIDESVGFSVAHTRLSIIDVSNAGHQPMVSRCGRYTIAYNGEVYNCSELRDKIDKLDGGFCWRGHSDTEILLAALQCWGVKGALQKINGMFAFALWDSVEKKLILARDRMGEKPLYYGVCGSAFVFGSELKSLTVHPFWQGEIDRNALALYIRHNYVPDPWSIYKGIQKLLPAHFVEITDYGKNVGTPRCYWNLENIIDKESNRVEKKSSSEWINELEGLLFDSVHRRMIADVPLGAFMSGGVDSSVVIAAMQAQSENPVNTYSIGFHEDNYDEARHARAVAKHLGTKHTELYVTSQEAQDVIPRLSTIWDEPFSDSSQIPTFLVSELAKRHVTVSLSGDGGDELFCGYNRYVLGSRIWNKIQLLPLSFRKCVGRWFEGSAGIYIEQLLNTLPKRLRIANIADKLPKLGGILGHGESMLFYKQLVSHWKNPSQIVLKSTEPTTLFDQKCQHPTSLDLIEMMMYLDIKTYLPGDILTKVDRASMAVGLECRVPLLDHRLVEFALKVPMEYKYRNGETKWLLKQVLDRFVPRELMDRPKMGFAVPIEHWLRGPLKGWADELLSEKNLLEAGYFDTAIIRNMWNEHTLGHRRWHGCLWNVLMFQSWLANK